MNEFRETLKHYSMKLIDAIEKVAADNEGIVDMNDWFLRFSFDVFAWSIQADTPLGRWSNLVRAKLRRTQRGRAASLDHSG